MSHVSVQKDILLNVLCATVRYRDCVYICFAERIRKDHRHWFVDRWWIKMYIRLVVSSAAATHKNNPGCICNGCIPKWGWVGGFVRVCMMRVVCVCLFLRRYRSHKTCYACIRRSENGVKRCLLTTVISPLDRATSSAHVYIKHSHLRRLNTFLNSLNNFLSQ